jgi:hypothetical protein
MSEEMVSTFIAATLVFVVTIGLISIIESGAPTDFSTTVQQPIEGFTHSSIFLGENMVVRSTTELLGQINGTVSRSLFENKELSSELKTGSFTNAFLTLDIDSASPSGSLVLSSSGTIYRKIPPYGENRFEVDPKLLSTSLTAKAASPALFFWGKTSYNFTAKIYGENRLEGLYAFYASADKNYELIAEIDDYRGGIDIYLNQNIIYSGEEEDDDNIIEISFKDLKHKNTIRFVPWDSAEYDFSYIYLHITEAK